MSNISILDESNTKEIINFEKRNIIREGENFYCDLEMNKMFLSDDTLLRKTMFDGTVMFAAEREGNKISKICMFAIPNQTTKSAVIKVLMCNRDPVFLGESIAKLEEFIEGSIYTKIRMTTYGEKRLEKLHKLIENLDMSLESVIETNIGTRYVFSKTINMR